MVTVAQMNAWNKAAHMAAMRKLRNARAEAVSAILGSRKSADKPLTAPTKRG